LAAGGPADQPKQRHDNAEATGNRCHDDRGWVSGTIALPNTTTGTMAIEAITAATIARHISRIPRVFK
jgi:thiazole synthase ThiGH ThiG subunit